MTERIPYHVSTPNTELRSWDLGEARQLAQQLSRRGNAWVQWTTWAGARMHEHSEHYHDGELVPPGKPIATFTLSL